MVHRFIFPFHLIYIDYVNVLKAKRDPTIGHLWNDNSSVILLVTYLAWHTYTHLYSFVFAYPRNYAPAFVLHIYVLKHI